MRVELLYDASAYHHTKSYMMDKKSDYPCVYSINKKGDMHLLYADKDRGLFVPKVMFGISQSAGVPILDLEGKYGMTEFIMGIKDEPEVLPFIATALNSDKFRGAMKLVQYTTAEWDRRIMELLRKDFWKEFV